jgi:hypothetical protein
MLSKVVYLIATDETWVYYWDGMHWDRKEEFQKEWSFSYGKYI